MPLESDDQAVRTNARGVRLGDVLPLPDVVRTDDGDPVRVTVVGGDAATRNRMLALLAGTPGVEVAGWADSMQALVMLGLSTEICLAVQPVPTPAHTPEVPVREEPVRPALSARQQQALVGYVEGNELLDVVARRLGMGTETLKTHLRRIRAKYEAVGRPAPTRRDLYVRAVEDGLLPPP